MMKRNGFAWALAGVAVVAAAMALVFAILVSATKSTAIRDAQVDNTETIDNTERALASTEETLRVLLDCTDPSGGCYKRGQDSQASAIENITRISIYAAACADKPREQSTQEIQDCILAELDAEKRKP